MAAITCAISGVKFTTSFLAHASIPARAGYFHPVFALEHESLYSLYSDHCQNKLTPVDSYLLFLAFLHSSSKLIWTCPATLNPTDSSTVKLIENNISQLLSVLERTGCISHPSFSQPSFKVTVANSNLYQIHNWIAAWEQNIQDFHNGVASSKEQEVLQKVENRLSYLILSGSAPEKYAATIASWADKAACFPSDVADEWKYTIRSCFNITKMFNTPLPLLKEIKDFCECNIEAGSIHFHALSNVLKEGIKRHVEYLGGSSIGYTLLPTLEGITPETKASILKTTAEVNNIIASASSTLPIESNYPTKLEFIKAKLAYRVSSIKDKEPKI